MIYFLLVILVFFLSELALIVCNKWLPVWFCHHLDWHLQPHMLSFNGNTLKGKCPRCGKEVFMDSMGDWF